MERVLVVLFFGLLVSCHQEEQFPEDAEKDAPLGPILANVPTVPYVVSVHFGDVVIFNLKMVNGDIEYFRHYRSLGSDWKKVFPYFEREKVNKPIILKVWASPETDMKQVNREIRRAWANGVSQIGLVVRAADSLRPGGILKLDPLGKGSISEMRPMVVVLNQGGDLFLRNLAGVEESLPNLETLEMRLELHKSAAEVFGSKTELKFRFSDEVRFGRFCEVFSYLRRNADRVDVIRDGGPEVLPPRDRLPGLPVAPRR